MHAKDKVILEQIQKIFTVGRIYNKKDGMVQYLVSSVKELQVIREHFEKYTLLTKKCVDFERPSAKKSIRHL